MNRYILGGALAGGAAIVMLAASRVGRGAGPEESAPPAAASVVLGRADVATVARADLIAGVPVSGTLKPAVTVEITSPYPEVVTAVLVKEGQAVARGQVLARFRSAALEPAALSAEAQRRIAASDLERMRNLFKEGAVSARDVENADVTLRAAEAAEAQARERLLDATVRAPVARGRLGGRGRSRGRGRPLVPLEPGEHDRDPGPDPVGVGDLVLVVLRQPLVQFYCQLQGKFWPLQKANGHAVTGRKYQHQLFGSVLEGCALHYGFV